MSVWWGVLTHAKKIAALAEAHYVDVIPHNPLGPISTAACLQLAACIPNFSLQEYPWRPEIGRIPSNDLLKQPSKVGSEYLLITDSPDIGVELNDEVLEEYPYTPRRFITRRHEDGSIVDQ